MPESAKSTSDLLDTSERDAMDAIRMVMEKIQNLAGGLIHNKQELVSAIHILQSFPAQHALHRNYPKEFSSWYGEKT